MEAHQRIRDGPTELGPVNIFGKPHRDLELSRHLRRVHEMLQGVLLDLPGKARPGIAMALQHGVKPDVVATVFAGADVEATERARGYFTGYPPSSPAVALLRGGKIIYMMERHQIENQEAQSIAADLTAAFDTHCATEAVS